MARKITSLDLFYLEQCAKRWLEDTPPPEPMEPSRELMKKVFLMKAVGRDAGWSFNGIASAWDTLFWEGKEINSQTMRESVQGILAARQLYKRLPKNKDLQSYSTRNLVSSLDSGVELSSSGDFLLSYPDRYETWVYFHSTPKRIRRSPLPAIEHYLIKQRIRDAQQKPFYLVIYYTSTKRKRAIHFRVRDNHSYDECRKIVYNLADRAERNIVFPSVGEHCKDCSIKC